MLRKNKSVTQKPLSYKMWGYFSMFSVTIMILLWLLQIIFLQTFYESMKVQQITSVGKELLKIYTPQEVDDFVNRASFQRGILVYVLDEDGDIIAGNDRFFRGKANDKPIQRKLAINKVKLGKAYIDENDFMRMRSVSYLAQIPNRPKEYLYIIAPLERVDATTMVLQNQLVIVTIISLLISFVLAYYISKRLAKPISDITKSAKALERGDYNVRFNNGGYKEVNELSSALNNAAEALSKSDQLRRDLMANVSHDLRTPLTIIKSYAEMIRDISGKDDTKRSAHSNVIIDEANRLSLLVNDILDLSKLQSGEIVYENKKFSFSDAVNATLESFKTFEEDGYKFETEINDNIYVCGDFQKIKSAIYNLILNAVTYTGGDKTVYIKLQKSGNKAVFSVTDTGNGIAEDEMPKVWERYYRSSNSHKRDILGSGIGLSIVKTILSAHNAEYGINSKLGEGSCFWFNLYIV